MARETYLERRWPNTPLFQAVADRWCTDECCLLLGLVWNAYDRLVDNDLVQVPFSADDEAKEESLNFLLSLRIDQCKSGDEPFAVVHETPEQTKRKRGGGKSPTPDIGFVLYEFPRTVWPVECMVLANERDVDSYVKEINHNLLSGRYATFSSEGAMIGYFAEGDASVTFACIEAAVGHRLRNHPRFTDRPHKLSDHRREDLPDNNSPIDFCCHHLIMLLRTVGATT
jgi:hypothetical protein